MIRFDAASNGSAASASQLISHTVAGSDRIILVGVAVFDSNEVKIY